MKKQKIIIFITVITIIIIIGIAIGANAIRISISNEEYNSSNSGSNNGNLLPEYIKAGITLGGVTGTLEDLDTSDATATEWDISYGKTAYVDGEKITGLFVPRSSLKVGQYVEYIPDTANVYSLSSTVSGYENNQNISQENFTWQIVGIDESDGTINLISNKPTSQLVYFEWNLGYNNAVYVLNDICAKQYSNESLGVTARSINLEDDIETEMNSKGIEARNSYIATSDNADNAVLAAQYGTTVTYIGGTDYPSFYLYYPSLYAQENGSGINSTEVKTNGIKLNDSYYSQPTSDTYGMATQLTATSTQFLMKNSETPNYFDSKDWYDLIFGENQEYQYWLASRCTWVTKDYAGYDIRFVDKGQLASNGMSNSYNGRFTQSMYLRPIVTLNSNIQIYGGDGSEEHPYQLTK